MYTIGIQGSLFPSGHVMCWVFGFSVNTLCGVQRAHVCDVSLLMIQRSNKMKNGNKGWYFLWPLILATVIIVFIFGIYVQIAGKYL